VFAMWYCEMPPCCFLHFFFLAPSNSYNCLESRRLILMNIIRKWKQLSLKKTCRWTNNMSTSFLSEIQLQAPCDCFPFHIHFVSFHQMGVHVLGVHAWPLPICLCIFTSAIHVADWVSRSFSSYLDICQEWMWFCMLIIELRSVPLIK